MEGIKKAAPGLAFCIGLAGIAFALAEWPVLKKAVPLSPLLIVIVAGMVLASSWRLPPSLAIGIGVAQKPVLRWAVGLLGLRLSFGELARLGGPAIACVVIATFAGLAAGLLLGKLFKLDGKLSVLLGVGGAICGASAIVAADSVVEARSEDTAAALGVVTLWGTVGILLLPAVGAAATMSDGTYGVWAGASLHEMAQVVAGAQAFSAPAVTVATVTKLARICLLAPVIFGLAAWARRSTGRTGKAKVSIVPWFLVAFVVCAGIRTLASDSVLPATWKALELGVTGLLTVGMAGVGLKASMRDVVSAGWRPVAVGLLQWVVMLLVAFLALPAALK